jgi:hypothetical protein
MMARSKTEATTVPLILWCRISLSALKRARGEDHPHSELIFAWR